MNLRMFDRLKRISIHFPLLGSWGMSGDEGEELRVIEFVNIGSHIFPYHSLLHSSFHIVSLFFPYCAFSCSFLFCFPFVFLSCLLLLTFLLSLVLFLWKEGRGVL